MLLDSLTQYFSDDNPSPWRGGHTHLDRDPNYELTIAIDDPDAPVWQPPSN